MHRAKNSSDCYLQENKHGFGSFIVNLKKGLQTQRYKLFFGG